MRGEGKMAECAVTLGDPLGDAASTDMMSTVDDGEEVES